MAKSTHTSKSKPPAKPTAKAKAKARAKPAASRAHAAPSVGFDMASLDVAWPRHKQPVNLRIDSDIIDWFRLGGAGYQTRMNAVLRAFVDAQTRRR